MVLKLFFLGIMLFIILFVLNNLLPRLKFKYKLHLRKKELREKQKAFANKMKELEIQ